MLMCKKETITRLKKVKNESKIKNLIKKTK